MTNRYERMATDALKAEYYKLRRDPQIKTSWVAASDPAGRGKRTTMEAIYEELKVRAGNA